jgi:hypothetical protein
MNIKTLLTLSLLAASFNAQSAVTACPSGWTKSADGLTCVLETKTTQTPNQSSNTAKPICIPGYAYSFTSMKCEQNTIASQFTTNKAFAYISGLRFGPNPQEEDICLNFAGTQTFQPANSYQSGGGNCDCNSDFQYNGLSDNNASCDYVPQVIDVNDTCPPGKYIDSIDCMVDLDFSVLQDPWFVHGSFYGYVLYGISENDEYTELNSSTINYNNQINNLLPYRLKQLSVSSDYPYNMYGTMVCK